MKRYFISLFFLVNSCLSFADVEGEPCQTYTDENNGGSKEVIEIIKLEPGGSVLVCTPPYGASPISKYYVSSKINRGREDTCYFTIKRVVEQPMPNGEHAWKYTSKDQFDHYEDSFVAISQSNNSCPSQSQTEGNYMSLGNVSVERFIEIVQFLKRFTSTDKGFDTAFSSLSWTDKLFSDDYHKLKSAQRSGIKLVFDGFSHNTNAEFDDSRYMLFISGNESKWGVEVVYSDKEFQVLSVGTALE